MRVGIIKYMGKGIKYKHVIDILENYYSKGLKVLEIGAGSARYRNIFDENDYIASDIFSPYIEDHDEIDAYFDSENIPFEDSTFDIVFCVGVLFVLNNANKSLSEVSRVLKSGGKFICIDYSKHIQRKLQKKDKSSSYNIKHYVYNDKDLISIFNNNNFKIVFLDISRYLVINSRWKGMLLNLLKYNGVGRRILNKFGVWRVAVGEKR
ncbi:MAG: class I SAM-dependent methyltransferase [Clostridia bacterium]|nr:class I SAM-dependent methyltransferase [Clostridia bacterium]